MATVAESKNAVLRVMRGENVEGVLDGLLEQPVDVDQDAPSEPTIEDYGPEELEQMANAADDAMTKIEAVYGNMLKNNRECAEACAEMMDEMRSGAERSQTDPIEGAKAIYTAMGRMEQVFSDEAYEGSDDDSTDLHTVMGEMCDAYEGFNIKLGGSDDVTDPNADGETTPGKPGGGVNTDVKGIKVGEQDDDDEDDIDLGDEEPPEEEPDEQDDEEEPEPPEAELGGEEEPDEEEDDLDMGDEEPGEEPPAEEQGECPVCGAKMEWSEDAEMDQCAECGYEKPAMEQDKEPPAEEPGDEEPEDDEVPPKEQDDEEPEDDEEEPTEARSCPHCRQPMKEDVGRGKNVCTFCKFELDIGA